MAWDKRFKEFAVPKLQQGRGNVRIRRRGNARGFGSAARHPCYGINMGQRRRWKEIKGYLGLLETGYLNKSRLDSGYTEWLLLTKM